MKIAVGLLIVLVAFLTKLEASDPGLKVSRRLPRQVPTLIDAPHTICARQVCRLPNETSLRFLLLGDWGGLPIPPYVTVAQALVARGMAKLGDFMRTHFQLALGDNMYLTGVHTEYSLRFQVTFEHVYHKQGSLANPWYLIAGNHDHNGNVDAQIAYTRRSDRWAFPGYYYTVRYEIANGVRIDFVMMDTIILCGNTLESKYTNTYEYYDAPDSDREAQGPQNLTAAEVHWRWVENELAKSTADYLFVAGHYPIYSSSLHGPTTCLVNRLRPMLLKYKVNAYFCGHDHNLQHLNETDHNGWIIHYVLSGAGAFEDMSQRTKSQVPHGFSSYFYPHDFKWNSIAAKIGLGKGGFVYAEVGQEKAEFRYVISSLKVEHSFILFPRKNAANAHGSP